MESTSHLAVLIATDPCVAPLPYRKSLQSQGISHSPHDYDHPLTPRPLTPRHPFHSLAPLHRRYPQFTAKQLQSQSKRCTKEEAQEKARLKKVLRRRWDYADYRESPCFEYCYCYYYYYSPCYSDYCSRDTPTTTPRDTACLTL